jgi:hypothetical protein
VANCKACDKSCKKCDGPGDDDCTECESGFDLVSGTCEPVCDEDCNSCVGPAANECDSCREGAQLAGASPNACTCKNGYFSSSVSPLTCEPCDPKCEKCNGPNDTDCTECPGLAVPDEKGSCKCPEIGYYEFKGVGSGSGLECKVCYSECLTCSGGASNQCTSCKRGRYLSSG